MLSKVYQVCVALRKFLSSERVMGMKQNKAALNVMARALAIALKVLTRRLLRR
ncbi:hypothetical protein HMPREF0541_02084 [Lacticaseibacillus rhamnosus ATCC 21052]|nr:hypothetical protein HMPREF0541_02084 [Lacticaseibacillus rhamnosus ATCC 21052]